MLKKSIAVVFAIALAMTATVASAQTFCNIAAYGDAGGTQSVLQPTEGQEFSVFVVLFTEDTAAAAAYSKTLPSGMFEQARFSGPSGLGLVIDEPTGTNVALGECAIGFGGLPVVVDEYRYVVFSFFAGGVISVGPNTSQDPAVPVYVDCNDNFKPCEAGADLVVNGPIDTEASSFSSIKSLYN